MIAYRDIRDHVDTVACTRAVLHSSYLLITIIRAVTYVEGSLRNIRNRDQYDCFATNGSNGWGKGKRGNEREKGGCYFVMYRRVEYSGRPDIRLSELCVEPSFFLRGKIYLCIHSFF